VKGKRRKRHNPGELVADEVEEELGIGVVFSARRPPAETRGCEHGDEERGKGGSSGVTSSPRLPAGMERGGGELQVAEISSAEDGSHSLPACLLDRPS
jgi:hypothetical protein